MKKNKINYKNFIQAKHINKRLQYKLSKKYSLHLNQLNQAFKLPRESLYSLSNNYKLNFKKKDFKTQNKFKKIVIIGMGGSILAAEAIYCFLRNKIKKNFVFMNDINEEKLIALKKEKNFKKILFLVISKSGNTIETLSNLLALKIIKKNAKNIIIISEKINNTLFLISKKKNLIHLEHEKYIGGRFSIFSDVGMLPAYFMGLNILEFRKNILQCLKKENKTILKKSVLSLTNLFLRKKFKNLVFLNYSPKLDKFLYWNQQLIAESLGKKGKGFFPTISKAPKDHHSLLQLYSDGPKDKIFYIFSEETTKGIKVQTKNLDKKVNYLNNKKLSSIKNIQKNSFIRMLKKKQIPFREFKIGNFSEQVLGELFSYFMIETFLIGKMSNINPFDQPGIEDVKINTKKLLT